MRTSLYVLSIPVHINIFPSLFTYVCERYTHELHEYHFLIEYTLAVDLYGKKNRFFSVILCIKFLYKFTKLKMNGFAMIMHTAEW